MDFKVILTPAAREDLREIVEFIARNDREAAEKFGYALIEKALSVARFPERGRSVSEFKDAKTREIHLRSYRIIYYVDEAHREVNVVRFWHAARGEPFI
jgi:addiction module RelE/StbE family toxin